MEIKNYLPLSTKREICEAIANNSLKEVDGMLVIDTISRDLSVELYMIQFYTDINMDELDMDKIYEDGTITTIRQAIPSSEYQFITKHANAIIQEKKEIHNSLAGVLNRNIAKLIEKIPDSKEINKMIPKLSKVFDKIAPENLELLKGIMNKEIK